MKNLMTFIIVLLIVLALSAGGYMLWTNNKKKKAATAIAQANEASSGDASTAVSKMVDWMTWSQGGNLTATGTQYTKYKSLGGKLAFTDYVWDAAINMIMSGDPNNSIDKYSDQGKLYTSLMKADPNGLVQNSMS